LWSANKTPGQLAGELIIANGLQSSDEGGLVASGPLNESATIGGEIENHLGSFKTKSIKINDVDVGTKASCNDSPIEEAIEIGGLLSLPVDNMLEREKRTAFSIPSPMGEHERGHTAITARSAMSAGIR
jgi:hypothetical protein